MGKTGMDAADFNLKEPRQLRDNIGPDNPPLESISYAEPVCAHKLRRRRALGMGCVCRADFAIFATHQFKAAARPFQSVHEGSPG